ncbi:hypothetical protein [Pseudoalteromonas luteoviolacea]|uniref:hypothetical protein n=1 Tax=Pseudoalteromonas luteoviolacea TaxID=43657 RepID=UPI001B38BA34|nr:hypothetical protein [Pseudoalteromonas luteoviolacea]MBQ4839780.1 hypothetical protein [Pseudoalteromonas luteoviolacea]
MSIFKKRLKKDYKVQFNTTGDKRERLEKVTKKLKELAPEYDFDMSGLLERDFEGHLRTAEKEIEKMEAEREAEKAKLAEQPSPGAVSGIIDSVVDTAAES